VAEVPRLENLKVNGIPPVRTAAGDKFLEQQTQETKSKAHQFHGVPS
jgi:hypothetical protein